MPAENQSNKLGSSSSPVMDRVIDNNKNVQQPVQVPAVVNNGQYNKQFVDVPGAGK
jgi:hypothetical protein